MAEKSKSWADAREHYEVLSQRIQSTDPQKAIAYLKRAAVMAENGNAKLEARAVYLKLAERPETKPAEAADYFAKADYIEQLRSIRQLRVIADHHSDEKIKREVRQRIAGSTSNDEEAYREYMQLAQSGSVSEKITFLKRAAILKVDEEKRRDALLKAVELGDFESHLNLFDLYRESSRYGNEAAPIGRKIISGKGDPTQREKTWRVNSGRTTMIKSP